MSEGIGPDGIIGRFSATMPLQPGSTLGSYQVTAKIGEGGVGEVYRARDTKLDRDVSCRRVANFRGYGDEATTA